MPHAGNVARLLAIAQVEYHRMHMLWTANDLWERRKDCIYSYPLSLTTLTYLCNMETMLIWPFKPSPICHFLLIVNSTLGSVVHCL